MIPAENHSTEFFYCILALISMNDHIIDEPLQAFLCRFSLLGIPLAPEKLSVLRYWGG